MLSPEEKAEIRRLHDLGRKPRAIARRIGRDPKTVRSELGLASTPRPPTPSKLEPFHDRIRSLAKQDLRSPRILREIRALGYTGGRSILKDFLKTLAPPKPPSEPFRRFETAPGVEAQSDWSPYPVLIAGVLTVVHAFSMVLCHSRRLFVKFYRNERLATLLRAHQEAFAYLGGICRRILYDNQTAITLGRLAGKPLWHPTFLDFARAYGFEPQVGRPRKKERRGKVERPFWYLEEDFVRGRAFESWDDLDRQAREWLDTVANVREHGTTRRYVHEAYAEEKPFLIALPSVPFPAERLETRKVQKDGYVPIDGSYYPVPAALVGQVVRVRIFHERVEILDSAGAIAAAHRVPEHPTRLFAEGPPLRSPVDSVSRSVLEARFLTLFPGASDFLDGLKRRMTTLTPIHLHALTRLATLYGTEAARAAVARAAEYRNFSARAVERILEMAHPTVVPEPVIDPLAAHSEALAALDDVDSGSPHDYTLDVDPPTPPSVPPSQPEEVEGDDHAE
jgi:transposase